MNKQQIERIEKLVYRICDNIIDGGDPGYVLDYLNEILESVGSEISVNDILEGMC